MKSKQFLSGIAVGILLTVFIFFFSKIILGHTPSKIKNIANKLSNNVHFSEQKNPQKRIAKNELTNENPFKDKEYSSNIDYKTIDVRNLKELLSAVENAHKTQQKTNIRLADGHYQLRRTLNIKVDYLALTSISSNPDKVVIKANGMFKHSRATNLIKVFANHFVLDGITLEGSVHHLIQISGENNADFPILRNCIMRDSYQQLLKITYDKKNRHGNSSDYGLIENCQFYYSAGIGPNYYIGGIDAHAINGWVIRNNTFKDIASPEGRIAEHAIHIWNNSYNNTVINNMIVDCDRGIGFGMLKSKVHKNITYSNKGGVIANNIIIHSDNNDPFADTGIILEDSPMTIIENNKIWLAHDYPNAIEYRYPSTVKVLIKNNLTNKKIKSRNGAEATLKDNRTVESKEDMLQNKNK